MSSIEAASIVSLAKKLRRSIDNGTKLHLECDEVAVLLHDEIYPAISRLEAEEMKKRCAVSADNDNMRLVASGSGKERTAEHGASAGSSAAEMDVMSRGARLRLLEAMSELKRPGKP